MKKVCKSGLLASAVLVAALLGACGGGGGDGATPAVETVTVSGAGSNDASTANKVFNLAAGDYTYTISGFANGDRLVFPTGTPLSVNNDNYTDGKVVLTRTTGSGVVTVELTGLSVDQDRRLNFATDFPTVFGTGSLTQ